MPADIRRSETVTAVSVPQPSGALLHPQTPRSAIRVKREKGWGGRSGRGGREGEAEASRAEAEEGEGGRERNEGRRLEGGGAPEWWPLKREMAGSETRDRAYDEARRCTHRPRGVVCASSRTARGSRNAHEESTRVEILGDRRTGVGRGDRLWQQRRGSAAADPEPSPRRHRRSDDERVADLTVRRGRRSTRARLMRRYFAVLDELRQQPDARPRASSATVATSTQLNARADAASRTQREQRPAAGRRHAHRRAEGPVGQPGQLGPVGGQGADRRHRRLLGRQRGRRLDKNGKSIVSPDRPDTGWTRYTVANYH